MEHRFLLYDAATVRKSLERRWGKLDPAVVKSLTCDQGKEMAQYEALVNLIIAAIFSLAFVNVWNELFLAVMLLSSERNMTVPVALNSFISKAGISWDVMSAGIVVALLPTMVCSVLVRSTSLPV